MSKYHKHKQQSEFDRKFTGTLKAINFLIYIMVVLLFSFSVIKIMYSLDFLPDLLKFMAGY
jgi:hypothetical protein